MMSKSNLNFRETLEELESITRQLESDEIGLDEAIAHFERGSKLAVQLQDELKKAQLKVEKIKARFDGESTEAVSVEATTFEAESIDSE